MNRKIKFRAWDKDKKRWTNYSIADDLPRFYDKHSGCWKTDKEYNRFNLIQYTGIKDKNGKEIYEGDILRNKKGEVFKCVWIGCHGAFELKNQENQYRSMLFANASFKDYEVIGNIYENEETMKNE